MKKKRTYLITIFVIVPVILMAQWNTDSLMNLGNRAFNAKNYTLSIQYFNRVIKYNPYHTDAYIKRAISKGQLKDYVGVETDCTIAIELNPFIANAYYARGYARNYLQNYSAAINDFTKALEFAPKNETIIINRAIAYEQNKHYENAIKDWELIKRLNKKRNIDFELGRIALLQNDTITAIKAYKTAIIQDSTFTRAHSILGFLYLQQENDSVALHHYNKAIKHHSKYVGDYINRGVIHLKFNHFKKALTDYNVALELEPNNALAIYNRGLLKAQLGDTNNAILDLEKTLKLTPDNYQARFKKAELDLEVGNLEEAIKGFDIILDRYPFLAQAYYGKSQSYKKMQKQAVAQHFAQLGNEIELNKKEYQKRQQIYTNNRVAKALLENKEESDGIGLFEKYMEKHAMLNDTTRREWYKKLGAEPSYILKKYQKIERRRTTNIYHTAIEKINSTKVGKYNMLPTCHTPPLTDEEREILGKEIATLSDSIEIERTNANFWIERAILYTTIDDVASALSDINTAIELNPNRAISYWIRANSYEGLMNNKQIKISKNADNQSNTKETNYQKLILNDLDRVIALLPNFTFAYYNKAIIYAQQNNDKSAVALYNKVISMDSNFAEAYYNRAISLFGLGNAIAAQKDLSKAGELGIYKTYKLLKGDL